MQPPSVTSHRLKALRNAAGQVLIPTVEVADRFWPRCVGLLGRSILVPGQALHVTPCAAIHTIGMRFALDVIFLDSESRVVKIIRGLRPYRFVFGGRNAFSALEMAAGWLEPRAIAVGDLLILSDLSLPA